MGNLWSVLSGLFADLKATDIVTALFTIVLAIATIQLKQATNVLARDTKENARQRLIQNTISAANRLLDDWVLILESRPAVHGAHIIVDLPKRLLLAMNEVEEISIGFAEGFYDMEILISYSGSRILDYYENAASLIDDLRNIHGSFAYQNTLKMYDLLGTMTQAIRQRDRRTRQRN